MEYKSTILIVDDEQMGRDTLEGLLFAQNYNLIFAQDGFEALAKAAQFKPDVILLDVMMPDLDGFEVCHKLRADPLLADVPIIIVTALDDQDSRLQGIEAGADDFISKPFDRIELRARIRTISRLNRYRRLLLERTKFEWVVEQTDDGYLILSDDDRILYANPQARLFLGLPVASKEATITESFLTLALKNYYHYQPAEAWHLWPGQSPADAPRYLVQPATSTTNAFWLQVNLIEMQTNPEKNYLIRLRDVTTNIAEQRSQWAFHAQVSHKLRTPLTLLSGFVDFLFEDEDALSDVEKKKYQSKARHNALELQKNIQEVFQYMKARDIIASYQDQCNLLEVAEIVAKLGRNLNLKYLNMIQLESDKAAAVSIPLSCQAIELILEELLQNAQKFHPQQNPALEIKISKHPDGINIQVADDGATLSIEQLSKIWYPYFQAEKGFSGQVPGMGLGLSMIASLIWSAGGTCRAYNRAEGPGIVVELMLPVIQADAV